MKNRKNYSLGFTDALLSLASGATAPGASSVASGESGGVPGAGGICSSGKAKEMATREAATSALGPPAEYMPLPLMGNPPTPEQLALLERVKAYNQNADKQNAERESLIEEFVRTNSRPDQRASQEDKALGDALHEAYKKMQLKYGSRVTNKTLQELYDTDRELAQEAFDMLQAHVPMLKGRSLTEIMGIIPNTYKNRKLSEVIDLLPKGAITSTAVTTNSLGSMGTYIAIGGAALAAIFILPKIFKRGQQ